MSAVLITTVLVPPNKATDLTPEDFDDKADAFVGDLPTWTTEANALSTDVNAKSVAATASAAAALVSENNAATSATSATASASSAINSPATNATSTSSITPVIGSNSFTLAQTGKAFVVGQFVTVADRTSPGSKFFNGAITAFNSGTGAITVDARVVVGTTGSDWVITASAPAQGEKFVSPVQTFVALGNVSGTVNIDLRAALKYSMTLTGNTTLTFTMPDLFTSSTETWVSLDITKSGSQTLSYPASTKAQDGTLPVLASSSRNELLMTKAGSGDWIVSLARKNIA